MDDTNSVCVDAKDVLRQEITNLRTEIQSMELWITLPQLKVSFEKRKHPTALGLNVTLQP